jgi:hypothetical protein
MSEQTKKTEKIEQEEKASELSDQELENAAGGKFEGDLITVSCAPAYNSTNAKAAC